MAIKNINAEIHATYPAQNLVLQKGFGELEARVAALEGGKT